MCANDALTPFEWSLVEASDRTDSGNSDAIAIVVRSTAVASRKTYKVWLGSRK